MTTCTTHATRNNTCTSSLPVVWSAAVITLAIIWMLPGNAWGADTWSTPHPGMSLLQRTTSDPLRIYALRVDTCARGVRFRATTETERQRTPTSFRTLVGAQAAINGDFFNYTGYYPIGLAVGDGTRWHNDSASMGFVTLGHDRTWFSPVGVNVSTMESWMREAVGGFPTLVSEGVPQYGATSPSHCPERHPRTAIGLSQDRQYMWLVVVDGRSSSSRGATCNELADIMIDLGAWNALNLDGGGSSALSVSGMGTVNTPSDGTERVVSNHWAVFASGAGAPDSCDLWMDEVIVNSGRLNRGSTDMNGDGAADLCARGASGFRCWISEGTGFAAEYWLNDEMSDAAGFVEELSFATIRTGDINGDGRMDVCARSAEGVRCWPSTGSGFGPAIQGPAWADSVGWGQPEHATTFRLADVTGDGLDDLCALASAGWICYPSTGTGIGPQIAGPLWTGADGWHSPWRYGTIRMGDLNGDGLMDVCGRGAQGMECAHSTGSGFSQVFPGPAWSDTLFTEVPYWSTIRMVDFDNDGLDDLCARTDGGIFCHRSLGDGTFGPAIAGPQLTDGSGWKDMANASTIRFGDIDGDGDQDICARANAGIWCWFFDGTGWGNRIDGPTWDDASGWSDFRLYTSISLGDMNNDGMADLCGRDGEQVLCYLSDGAGFPTAVTGPTMRDSDGWALYPYFSTLRFGGVVAPDQCVALAESDLTCDGVDDDCDGAIDEDANGACDDQDQCNGVEMCSGTGAGCVAGTPLDCGGRGCLPESGCCPEGTTLSGESCLPDSCDPGNDLCEDGNMCNGVAACNPQTLSCQTGAAPDCGDRGCLPESGCCPEGTALLDGACVETEGGSTDASGGCSCSHGRGTPPPVPTATLFLLALVWLRRRP